MQHVAFRVVSLALPLIPKGLKSRLRVMLIYLSGSHSNPPLIPPWYCYIQFLELFNSSLFLKCNAPHYLFISLFDLHTCLPLLHRMPFLHKPSKTICNKISSYFQLLSLSKFQSYSFIICLTLICLINLLYWLNILLVDVLSSALRKL